MAAIPIEPIRFRLSQWLKSLFEGIYLKTAVFLFILVLGVVVTVFTEEKTMGSMLAFGSFGYLMAALRDS